VSLAARLPSTEGEHSCLMPLLPSIGEKQRTREGNPKRGKDEEKNVRWFLAGNEGDIYSQESVVPLQ
jgi:hypothetical protein